MLDWRGAEVEVAKSAGGVLALANPWEDVVRGGVLPWPPPELIQKLYQADKPAPSAEPTRPPSPTHQRSSLSDSGGMA
jgi:hypothetical protein